MEYLIGYLIFINLFTFALCGIDKLKAKKHWWRIPERTLFISAALGGSIGLLAGMKLFRHKTLHKSFTIGAPLILLLQIALVLAIVYKTGGFKI